MGTLALAWSSLWVDVCSFLLPRLGTSGIVPPHSQFSATLPSSRRAAMRIRFLQVIYIQYIRYQRRQALREKGLRLYSPVEVDQLRFLGRNHGVDTFVIVSFTSMKNGTAHRFRPTP